MKPNSYGHTILAPLSGIGKFFIGKDVRGREVCDYKYSLG
jgi:hypothetical protein